MPPKKIVVDAAATGPKLTEGEYSFMRSMFNNLVAKPDVDWDEVANDLKLKDSKCAKERYRQMSIKHNWNNSPKKQPSNGSAAGPTKPTPKKITKTRAAPKKAKKEAKKAANEEEDDNVKEEKASDGSDADDRDEESDCA